MTEKNSEILKYYISEIENEISKYLIITENNQPQSVIINAMKHSISTSTLTWPQKPSADILRWQ